MGSRRLPGKVLLPLANKNLLEVLVERCFRSKLVNEVIIATTNNQKDDVILDFCIKKKINYFRGSESNVLKRLIDLHIKYKTDIVVELTADNPFVDPKLIDEAISFFLKNKYHYVSNSGPSRKYPDGMNVQVFALETLKKIYPEANTKQDFEHPSSQIYKSNKFNVKYIDPNNPELIWPELSLTVDTIKDYEFVKKIYENFGHNNFTIEDIIRYLKYSNKNKINH